MPIFGTLDKPYQWLYHGRTGASSRCCRHRYDTGMYCCNHRIRKGNTYISLYCREHDPNAVKYREEWRKKRNGEHATITGSVPVCIIEGCSNDCSSRTYLDDVGKRRRHFHDKCSKHNKDDFVDIASARGMRVLILRNVPLPQVNF